MRPFRLIASASTLAAAVAAPAAERWSPEIAFKVKRVSTVRVSPDATWAAFVVGTPVTEGEKSEWLSQIHLARADGSGTLQLTRGDTSSTAPAWSPDGRFIAFLSARGAADPKEARTNLWRIPAAGGEAERLTDQKSSLIAFEWSPDGSQLAFLMQDPRTDDEEKAAKEKRDARVVDANLKMIRLYLVPAEPDAEGKRPVRKLAAGDFSVGSIGGPGDFSWSPDGKTIVFSHQPTPHIDDWPKADLSLVDVASGSVTALARTGAEESDPHFSRDGKTIAYALSNDPPTWRRRSRVALVPASGGAPRLLAATHDEQPGILGFLSDGRVLVSEGYRTATRLWALPADGGAASPLGPADRMIDGAALNPTRTHVGFTSQSPAEPSEAHLSPVASFSPARVSKVQQLSEMDLGRTELVSWKSPDKRDIEGLLTYPVGYRPGQRVPLLVVVHGGPAGVFTQAYTGGPSPYPVAGFAGRGYAVLRANVRGSSGYGFEFRNANFKDWGGGDYRDILSGVDSLIARGVADPERLGVMGWSYGGYMTSWIISQTRRFKAASVGAGVTNLMSFTGTADIPGFLPDYFGGEFWEPGGLELWRAHSAMFNIKGAATPTLIQHGEADLRVPISQGYELYNALKRQRTPVTMVVYPRQPHGIQEPKLLQDAMERNLEWFDRWILGQGQPAN